MPRQAHDPRPADAIRTALASGVLAGLSIAGLTVGLNRHLREGFADTLVLQLYGAAAYGLAMLIVGGLAALLVRALAPLPKVFARQLRTAIVAMLALAPLIYVLLLPDTGLGLTLLTDLIFAPTSQRLVLLAGLGLAMLAFAMMATWLLTAMARRLGIMLRHLLVGLWGVAVLAVMTATFMLRPPAPVVASEQQLDLPPAPETPPPRVVLLTIDGADLDDRILPMVEAGELPHFASLMRDGTWGFLDTFEPTLSAVVWTSLITGKPSAAHGIHHFLHFRLPGLKRAIYEFPLHTGLNFRLFPLLEHLPGMPRLRKPFTSNMRQVEALWNIVGRRYPVGVYRWLITWPAEAVNGFVVPGGVAWIDFETDADQETAMTRDVYPRDLRRRVPAPPLPKIRDEDLQPYVGVGFPIDRQDRRLKPILYSLRDRTSDDLKALISAFDSRFTAAQFYSVDAFHHLFNIDLDATVPYANAIAERYRQTDARLGEMLDFLGEDTQVLVISDHGFDFIHHHHTYAPPGVFFARGPAFDPGRQVTGLSVYDIAPLVLHLLQMPLPDDMPGARDPRYRQALSQSFLDQHPVERIPTYEIAHRADHEAVTSPQDEALREALESLGYIQ